MDYQEDVKNLYERREWYFKEAKKFTKTADQRTWVCLQERSFQIDKQIQNIEHSQGNLQKHLPIGTPLPWKENMADEQGKPKIKTREVTVAEVKELLQNILKTHITPFIWGPPGVGKSSIVKEIAKEKGWKIIDLRLSLLNPVDLRGLPTVNHVEHQANWLPPSFLPKESEKEAGILFLDEINLAPLSVQAAAYQLILDKQIGEYKFPKTWKIIAAGNRETDRANVFKISAPLANRFIHFTVRPDFYEWKNWAENSGIHPNVVHFLTMRPAAIFDAPAEQEKAFPSPRSWQFVAEMMDAFDYNEEKNVPDTLIQVIFGAVGEGTGREFIEHLNSNKLQEINNRLSEFIRSGKLTMPRSTSQRLTLIASIFEAYAAGKLDQLKYDNFRGKITAEETKALDEFEKENADRIASKFKNINRAPQGGVTTELTAILGGLDAYISVKSTKDFNDSGTLLVLHPNGKHQQLLGYSTRIETKFLDLKRVGAAQSVDFPIGSTVNKLA